MANVCRICGNRIDSDDNYCVICDKVVGVVDENDYVPQTSESVFAVYNKKTNPIIEHKKTSKVQLLLFIIVGLAIIAGAYVYIMQYASKTYEGVVDKYYSGLYNEDHSMFVSSILKEEYKKYEVETELIYSGAQADKVNGIKYEYEIVGSNKAYKEKKDKIEAMINIDLDTKLVVSEAYFVDVRVTKSGAESGTENVQVWSVKVDGVWYAYVR